MDYSFISVMDKSIMIINTFPKVKIKMVRVKKKAKHKQGVTKKCNIYFYAPAKDLL